MRLLDLDALAGLLLIGRRERLVEIRIEFARRIVGHVEQRDIGGECRTCQQQSRDHGQNTADHLNLHSAVMAALSSGTRRYNSGTGVLSQRNRISLFAALQRHCPTKS